MEHMHNFALLGLPWPRDDVDDQRHIDVKAFDLTQSVFKARPPPSRCDRIRETIGVLLDRLFLLESLEDRLL
jgi:hypothetical protein